MQNLQEEIEFFRKEYRRQKALEKIVNKRELKRPKTKKWQVVLLLSFVPVMIPGAVLLSVFLKISLFMKITLSLLSILFIIEIYLRFCLIQVVKCYQHYAKDETRRRCLCIPSCSEYAALSLKRIFPLTLALLKIRKRLYVTCDGEEYKVDFPCKKMNAEFEKDFEF